MKPFFIAIIATVFVCGMLHADDIQVNPEFAKAGADFDAALWETAYTLQDFKVPLDDGKLEAPTNSTEIRIGSDGTRVYIRINAFDSAMEHVKVPPPPVDGYLNKFPSGDHAEFAITANARFIFAFDCNGNKYLSKDYALERYCWYELNVRKTALGWDAIVAFDWDNLVLEKSNAAKAFSFQAARHTEHGQNTERSFASGRSLLDSKRLSLVE